MRNFAWELYLHIGNGYLSCGNGLSHSSYISVHVQRNDFNARVCVFYSQEGFSHCASEACSFLLSLPGLDSVVGRRLVEYLAKSVSRALESQLPAAVNKHPAAASMTAISAASTAPSDHNHNDSSSNNNINNNDNDHSNAVVVLQSEAVARGHTPPSSDPPSTPPGTTALMTPCPRIRAAGPAATSPVPHQRPVALTASNRGPHMIVRPKPTRPTLGRSSSPQNDAAAAVAVAAQRDPMWRPW